MPDATTLATYMVVVLGLFLIPGPAVLLVLARGTSGRSIGIATGLGVAFGDLIHTVMATLGLSAILMTSALAFEVVKWAGAAYLVWLGLRAILEKSDALAIPVASRIGPAKAFRQAILAELLNPKTALFFLAFLPQFVSPARGSVVSQLAVLGLVFVAMSAVYTTLIALVAGAFGRWLQRHPGIGRWQGKVVGAIFIALGLRLAAQHR